jgi:hypothetical protein
MVYNILQIVSVEAHRLGRELENALDQKCFLRGGESCPGTRISGLSRATSTRTTDATLNCGLANVEQKSGFPNRHVIGLVHGNDSGNSTFNIATMPRAIDRIAMVAGRSLLSCSNQLSGLVSGDDARHGSEWATGGREERGRETKEN